MTGILKFSDKILLRKRTVIESINDLMFSLKIYARQDIQGTEAVVIL